MLILPGVSDRSRLEEMIERADPLVILKAGRNFNMISAVLADRAADREVILVSNLRRAEERIETDIHNLPDGKLPYLSLLLIKKQTI